MEQDLFTADQAIRIADTVLRAKMGRGLTDVQAILLRGSFDRETYEKIAEASGYSANYLRQDVGARFWKDLSDALGEPVSKPNFQTVLRKQWQSQAHQSQANHQEPDAVGNSTIAPTRTPDGLSLESFPLDLTESTTLQEESIAPLSRTMGRNARIHWDPYSAAPDVSQFYGRQQNLEQLSQWLYEDCRLINVFGVKGIGKTALAGKLILDAKNQFEVVIWRSFCPHLPQSLETLLADLVRIICPHLNPRGTLAELSQALCESACLIVLDGWEAVLQAGVYDGAYRSGYEAYGQFLNHLGSTTHQSRILITSREKPREVEWKERTNGLVRSIELQGWKTSAVQSLCQQKNLTATSELDWQELGYCYMGHPIALEKITARICTLFDGNLSTFLQQSAPTLSQNLRQLLSEQTDRISPLEHQILHRLAQTTQPMEVRTLMQYLPPELDAEQVLEGLQSLRRRSLILKERTTYTLHPLMVKFLAEKK
jgi:hypothetical protein